MRDTKKQKPTHSGPPEALLSAVKKVLKPLILLMINHGIGFPFFSQLAKGLFVETALEHLSEGKDSLTDSRLALMTGVHRKDIRRLKKDTAFLSTPEKSASLGAQVISLWISRKEYLDTKGNPKPLPRLASQAKGPSFESLVRLFSVDIRPRAILDEWLRMGVVAIDAEDRVCLKTEAFIPKEGLEDKAHFFGQSISDHIRAASYNLDGNSPALFDRCVYFNGLSSDAVALLEEIVRADGMTLLKKINAKAQAMAEEDAKNLGQERFNLGIYFFKEKKAHEPKP